MFLFIFCLELAQTARVELSLCAVIDLVSCWPSCWHDEYESYHTPLLTHCDTLINVSYTLSARENITSILELAVPGKIQIEPGLTQGLQSYLMFVLGDVFNDSANLLPKGDITLPHNYAPDICNCYLCRINKHQNMDANIAMGGIMYSEPVIL